MTTISVLGATGHIGRQVVTSLLQQGYSVTAFCHGPSPFPHHNSLRIITGDVHQEKDLREAISGSDAIISALGSWHTPTQDILSSATKHLVAIIPRLDIHRLVTLTGADARSPKDHPTIFQQLLRPVFLTIAPMILRDAEDHLQMLQASQLNWTSLRSPVMRSFGSQGRYKVTTTPPSPWATIHRRDVVTALIQLAVSDNYTGQAVYIK